MAVYQRSDQAGSKSRSDTLSVVSLNILLLCNRPARSAEAAAVSEHLDALQGYSRHTVRELSFLGDPPAALELEQFDVLVIHYSVAIGYLSEHYLSAAARSRVSRFPGLKVVFMQDEYRRINLVHEALRCMGVHLLFTCVPETEIGKVYPVSELPGLTKVHNFTGYVSEPLAGKAVAPIAARAIDVGYRTRKPPYWLGELGAEKWQIADRFTAYAQGTDLRLDLSYQEADRFYGRAWTDFVCRCKAMLGVESGASVFDFEGTIQRDVEAYVEQHPGAGFAEVQERFLQPHEGRIRLNQISPRCFEAAALRTAMVLYEGQYSGVLRAWRHYVPLNKDFSNFADVLDALRDPGRLQRIADCCYDEIARNPKYGYRAFVERFDDAIEREFERRDLKRPARPYSATRYATQVLRSPRYLAHRLYSRTLQWLLLGTPLRRFLVRLWERVPFRTRRAVRPLLRLIGR